MTASILMAYDWAINCPPSWRERALNDFKSKLTGGYTPTVASTRGEIFEGNINAALLQDRVFDKQLVACESLRGMMHQVWIEPLNIDVDGSIYTFRGKVDYVGISHKPPLLEWKDKRIIVDLKTTMSEIKPERYENSWQHVIYALAMNIPHVAYLVYRFPDEGGQEPMEGVFIPIDLEEEMEDKRLELANTIRDLILFLEEHGLYDEYFYGFNGGRK